VQRERAAAPFRPLMRLYQPQAPVLDGTYKIPPVTKAADWKTTNCPGPLRRTQ
jgi:hypothetical protein